MEQEAAAVIAPTGAAAKQGAGCALGGALLWSSAAQV